MGARRDPARRERVHHPLTGRAASTASWRRRARLVDSSSPIRSVKVPPVSIPMRTPICSSPADAVRLMTRSFEIHCRPQRRQYASGNVSAVELEGEAPFPEHAARAHRHRPPHHHRAGGRYGVGPPTAGGPGVDGGAPGSRWRRPPTRRAWRGGTSTDRSRISWGSWPQAWRLGRDSTGSAVAREVQAKQADGVFDRDSLLLEEDLE